jgi:xanthine/CO dehydrogenase XdhC/CoxF family maturation factor
MNDVFTEAAEWRQLGRKVAVATVVSTWGSSPRPVGSQLAVDDKGGFIGSVSGGCIEGAVVEEALAVLADGRPRLLTFGITDEMAWEVGLACGGRIEIFVEELE